VPTKKPRRPRFVPQMILASTTLAGLAVVPAVALDCGGKTTGGSEQATVAAAFEAGGIDAVAAAFEAGFGVAAVFEGGIGTVAASFEGGFTVAAVFEAGSDDAPGFTVAAVFDSGPQPDDSGPQPDAFGFVVAANMTGGTRGDGPGKG
jgi:hypothetical protein